MKKSILIALMACLSIAAFAQNKFAHVRFSELVQLMPEADEARAQLAAASQETSSTYQEMFDEFQSKYQVYQQNAGTWSASVREIKERELTEIQQRIQEFEQNAQAELQQQQQQLMAPIIEKAQKTVKDLAKQAGYIYVFDENTLVYFDETQSDDLTVAARKALGISEDKTLEGLQNSLAAAATAEPIQ